LFYPFIAAASPPVHSMMLVRPARDAGTGNKDGRNKSGDENRIKVCHDRSPDGSIRGGVPAEGTNFAAIWAA